MSVERRINIPARHEFATQAEAVKNEVGLDESVAEDIYNSLSPEARSRISMADIMQRVRRRIDPKLVDSFYRSLQSQ